MRDGADWRNPFLVVYTDGVEVVGIAERVSPDALPAVLAQLPKSAWPYGRVVGVMECGILPDNHSETMQNEILAKVLKSLKELGIEVHLWPSA